MDNSTTTTNKEGVMVVVKRFFTKHPIIANLLCIVLVGIVLIFASLVFLDSWTHHGETSVVPEVKGLNYESAKTMLLRSDLEVEIADSIYDRKTAPGIVLESWPKAGSVVKRGRQVYLTITSFSPKMLTLSMPVIGVSSRQAVSYLEALGITSIRLLSVPSQYPDLVENAYYDGKTLAVGTSLPVTASVTLEVGTVQEDEYVTDSLDVAIDEQIEDLEF